MAGLAGATAVTMIFTRDRGKATQFYAEVLGLPLVRDDGFASVMDLNGVPLRITEIPDHVASPHTVLGWQVDDIAAAMADLASRGVTFLTYPGFGQDEKGVWTAPNGAAKVAWFVDTDGNNLSLTQFG
jgi:catechol 2,3-dioxygenase-like lactoylglutathione lyase family enzyme